MKTPQFDLGRVVSAWNHVVHLFFCFVLFWILPSHLLISQSMRGSKGSVIRTHMAIFYMLGTRGSEWSRNRDMGQSGDGKTVKIISGISDKCPVLVFVLNKQTNKQVQSSQEGFIV